MNVFFHLSVFLFIATIPLVAQSCRFDLQIEAENQQGKKIIPDYVLVDGKKFGSSNALTPGSHKIIINKDGFEDMHFTIDVPYQNTPFLMKKTLMAKQREVRVKLWNYEIQQPQILSINGRSLIRKEVFFKPGIYEMIIFHPGYFKRKEQIVIEPGTNVFEISRVLVPLSRFLQIKWRYDVPPITNDKNYTIRMRGVKQKKFTVVKAESWIIPGEYEVEVRKTDYKLWRKTIRVIPQEKPYDLVIDLEVKPRNLGQFKWKNSLSFTRIVIPEKVILNGVTVTATTQIKPSIQYRMIAFFREFATVDTFIAAAPGEEPFDIELNLKEYKSHNILIGRKYEKYSENGNLFPLQIFIDGKLLQQHHILPGEGFHFLFYQIFVPKDTQVIRVSCGYYYEELPVENGLLEFRELLKVDLDLFLKHIQKLKRDNLDSAIATMHHVLNSKIYKLDNNKRLKVVLESLLPRDN